MDVTSELSGLRILFQPIFELVSDDLRIHALECLSRGPRGSAMDLHCLETAFAEAALVHHRFPMHINVHATTIAANHELADFIGWSARAHEIDIDRVVVEVVDDHPASISRLRQGIDLLRRGGIAIALDNMQMILDCKPCYFKIDRQLISGIDRDKVRQSLVRSIVAMSTEVGARPIAQGIEMSSELETVRELGVSLAQGFLLAPPREACAFSSAWEVA